MGRERGGVAERTAEVGEKGRQDFRGCCSLLSLWRALFLLRAGFAEEGEAREIGGVELSGGRGTVG